ncbi:MULTISPECIES: transporter substrate-binding domain-containing protein [unclassified Pseudomonas]|uniref:substrate-binding periplasmic protein n=1 Tax=unclassified Pseudomonas TaxID=196821 RepID=UPI00244A4C02|nr:MULTISPECIES: transporter substrate-binding domain-containing protein [unclassified Pseudomonas]MDG9926958.1 transporter substrate-binding domain-containing protein [Pseudomonas sp. GD04042]MDH0484601.1 transporter substrate-binding domain-containing protein [Pseudomonas sp. GD04015]MDH0602373.1 transporter substrate-binding domain-containing protein [Pseudomonas sp. GD03869]MDH0894074.1 transporter substrate-binding domain-containing protein [Pseudomonas sp. GD03875]MDH1062829.1 transporte
MPSRAWPWLWMLLAPAVMAESLRIGFGTHKPPYVFENESRGLEYDIVAAAVSAAGYELDARYAPMERLHLAIVRGELDGIATTNAFSGVQAYYSQPYIHCQNVALALSSRGYRITGIADLGHYSISAFQRARYLLGPEFQAMAEANPRYREEALQINRNRLLYSGRVEVAVGDPRILRYFNREVADQVDTTQPVTQYLLFPPTAYSVGFRLKAQAERFDRGLALIRASGQYLQIEQRYADY